MTSALSQAHILKHSGAVAAHSFSESSGKHCRVAKKKKNPRANVNSFANEFLIKKNINFVTKLKLLCNRRRVL